MRFKSGHFCEAYVTPVTGNCAGLLGGLSWYIGFLNCLPMQSAEYTSMIEDLHFSDCFCSVLRWNNGFLLANISRHWFRRHLVLGTIDSLPLPCWTDERFAFCSTYCFIFFPPVVWGPSRWNCISSWVRCENRFAPAVETVSLRSINHPCFWWVDYCPCFALLSIIFYNHAVIVWFPPLWRISLMMQQRGFC